MKELRGTASTVVAVPIDRCFALLEAVDGYPGWYPDVVRSVEIVERNADGRPTRARTDLHVSAGPLTHDFHLLLVVESRPPGSVKLRRVPHHGSDAERFEVSWQLSDEGRTRIAVGLEANLSVPRFLPLGGIGDSMAQGFVAAAARALA